jgi:phage-related minor tail protein
MSDDRKVRLGITADSGEAEGAFKRVEDAAKKAGKGVKEAGEQAGKGMDGFTEPIKDAPQKFDRATKSIIASIERATAAAEAGGRSSAAYFETIAKQRGISGDALKPYLDGLKQAEAAQAAAAASLGNMGMSAKATAAALRQVPAQFTDIATSLAAGQAPLTVFLQQGGQLKDTLGGAGAAAKALGGYVLGLINPITIAAGAALALGAGFLAGAKEAQEFNKALVLTGNAAGVTVGQLQDMARAQAAQAGTQGRAAEVLAQMAASGNVAAAQLSAAADAAIRLERAGGPAAEETAKKFAKLGEDPVRALVELNKAENSLTEGVYKQVQALQEQGRTAEAASVAQIAYATAVADRAETLASSLGTLERGWLGVKDLAKQAWDAMLNVGRADTAEQELEKIAAKIEETEQRIASLRAGRGGPLIGGQAELQAQRDERDLQSLREKQSAYQELVRIAKRGTTVERERAAAVKATIKAEQDAARASRERSALAERDIVLQERAIGLSGSYVKDLRELQSARQRGVLTEEQYLAAVQKVAAAQPVMVANAKALADAEAAKARALAEGIRAYEQQVEAQRRSAQSVADQVQKLRDEEQAAALAAAGNLTLAEAIQQVAIARLEEAQSRSLDISEVDRLQREIDARRELATLLNSREARDAAKRSAQDAAREWERAGQDIERSLTDALLRGFESGKGFASNLVATLKNLFSTLVLRPVIQPIAGALAGSLGLAGSASAATAAGGLGGLSSLSTLGGLLSSGGLLGNTLSVSGGLLGFGELSSLGIGEAFGGSLSALAGGNIAGGLSSLAGAALPFIGGAALIGNALGLFRSNRQVGAGITGQLGGTVEDFVVNRRGGSLFSGPSYSTPTVGVSSLNADLQATFNALRQNAASMAEALGLSGAAARNFTTAIGSDKLSDDTGGQGLRLEGLSAEEVTAKLQEELTRANERLAEAVLGSSAAAFAKSGETASQTLERLSGSLGSVNSVLGVLGQALLAVSTSGGNTASQLLEQFGGLQQYQSAAGQYLQAYYTEAERTSLATANLTSALAAVGLAVPASRDAYRDLVEAQDLSTESGRKAYAALLQLAPSFAELVPAIEGVGTAVDQTAAQAAEAGRRVLEDLARSRGDLEVELLRAQGNTTGANTRQRTIDLAGLTTGLNSTDAAAATAAYDYNAALRAQIDTLLAATQAAEAAAQAEAQRTAAIANERAGLQQQIDQLEGNTAALRARELAGLDASNRALQERIFALQDAAQAEAAAARAAEEAAQRAQAIASERAGLDRQLLQLQGNTTALRALELAGLDASNRALQEQIFALQDQQAAAEAAAQALQAFRDKLAGLGDIRFDLEQQLLQAQGNNPEAARLLRERDLARLTAGLSAEQAAQIVAAYDYNEALRAQITATTEARQAADALAAEQARAADAAQQAAEQFRNAWQSVSDSLFDEVSRIRGLIQGGPGGLTLAAAQAQFAIATGQARAGDQDAARSLPGLSQTLLELATANAGSLLELNRIRAAIAASLEQTGTGLAGRFGLTVPRLATGTNLVPRDMLALLHDGEAVVPAPFNPAAGGAAGSPEVVQGIRQLLDAVQAGDLATVRQLGELLRIVKTWDGNGLPEERVTI